ncbi:MAG: methyltransferase domain-containing protein [Thiotrichales bacterium]|nr:methyltransferase domain-containing protein [Thiotrichales bacterium]
MSTSFQQLLKQHYASALGSGIYAQERRLIDAALANLFGYFVLQLGAISEEDLLAQSRVNTKVLLDSGFPERAVLQQGLHFVQADLDYLPIGRDQVDVILLPHTFEAAADPHLLLRQVDTMLRAEGHLVITGFHAKGCWVWRQKWFNKASIMQQAQLVDPQQLQEWLSVLGYEVKQRRFTSVQCAQNPASEGFWAQLIGRSERLLQRLGWQFGNVYCLVAKKKLDAPTLVGVKWRMPRWQAMGSNLSSSKAVGVKEVQNRTEPPRDANTNPFKERKCLIIKF